MIGTICAWVFFISISILIGWPIGFVISLFWLFRDRPERGARRGSGEG